MRRTAGWLSLIAILLLAAVGAHAAPALQSASQSGAQLPAILYFSADVNAVDYGAVEAGTSQIALSWQTINADDGYRLELESLYQNGWVSALGAGEVLPMTGTRQTSVTLTGTFANPTFRLTLLNPSGRVVEQQYVTLGYIPTAQAAGPHIVSFTTEAESVDTNLLIQNNVRLVVYWQIENRTPDTLLRFEQVLADGSTLTAELPRGVLWIPSRGTGAVVPRPSTSKADLIFRLSLLNATTGDVYDAMDLSVPVTGNVVVAIPAGVQSQSASRSVAPGGSVVLNWNESNADRVEVLQRAESGPTTLYIELPPQGSMTVEVPPDSGDVTYTLRAYSASGEVVPGELSVSPESAPGG